MGREVRRVPKDWEHPRDENGKLIPMHGYSYELALASHDPSEGTPSPDRYMPNWPDEERTHIQMYETTSEGTPISPVMETAEELAQWLYENKASSFANMTATYSEWFEMIKVGWAPSAFLTTDMGIISGVAAIGKR